MPDSWNPWGGASYVAPTPKTPAQKNVGDWVNGKQITWEDFAPHHTWNPHTKQWEQNEEGNWWEDWDFDSHSATGDGNMFDDWPEYQIPDEIQQLVDLYTGYGQQIEQEVGAGVQAGIGAAEDALGYYQGVASDLTNLYGGIRDDVMGTAQDQFDYLQQAGQNIYGLAGQQQAMLNQQADQLVNMYGLSREQALEIARRSAQDYRTAATGIEGSARTDMGLARGEAGLMRDEMLGAAGRLDKLYGGVRGDVMREARRERREVMGELTGMRSDVMDIYQQRAYSGLPGERLMSERLGASTAAGIRNIREIAQGGGGALGAVAQLHQQQQQGLQNLAIQGAQYQAQMTGELGQAMRATALDVAQGYRGVAQDYIDANLRSAAMAGSGMAQAAQLRGSARQGYIDTVRGTGADLRGALATGAGLRGAGAQQMLDAELSSAQMLGQGMATATGFQQAGYQGMMDAATTQAGLMQSGYQGLMDANLQSGQMLGQGMYQGASLIGQGYGNLQNAYMTGAGLTADALATSAGLQGDALAAMANQRQLQYQYNELAPHQAELQFNIDQMNMINPWKDWLNFQSQTMGYDYDLATGGRPY